MVLQLLLGGVSGIYVIFRIFKQKILGLFGIRDAEPAGESSGLQTVSAKENQSGRQA